MQNNPGAQLPLAGRREFAAGLFLLGIAIAIAVAAFGLRIGTPARMGPGFLPLALGILLGFTGCGVMLTGRGDTTPRPSFDRLRPLTALVLGFIAFAFLIESAGLALAAFAAVFLASFAAPGRRWIEAALFAGALSAFAVLLFVVLLDMPLEVWP